MTVTSPKNMQFVLCILFVYLLPKACFTHALDYQVTSFIEREPFINKTSYYEHYYLLNSKNITVHSTYVYVTGEDSLMTIMDNFIVPGVSASSKAINLYSSLVSAKTSAMLENALSLKQETFYALQKEGCLRNSEDIDLLLQKCRKSKTVYIELIKSLMKNLYLWPVAIIADQDECSLKLSDLISKELRKIVQLNNPNNDISSNIISYQLRNIKIQSVRQILYDIKLRSVSIVILLCDDGLSNVIFKVASKFSVLRFKRVWLMIESTGEIDDSIAPSQLLLIKHDSTATVMKSSLIAKKDIVDALNLMLVAKDAKQKGLIANSDFYSLDALARNKLKTGDCHDQHSAKTALVSLRKSQYNWIPLYKWSGHSNLILLSNDAQFLRISRSKLQGITLRIVTAIEHPFVMQFDQFYLKDQKRCQNGILCKAPVSNGKTVTWKDTCCIGYLMDMLQKLQDDLWFQTSLYLVEDQFYGAVVNGSWNGIVGDLLRNKADLSVAAITSTRQRSTVVDFSEPFMEVSLSILMLAKQETNIPFFNFAFVGQISSELLWAILGVFLAGMTLVYVLENQSRNVKCKHSKLLHYPLKECFTYFSGLTFQRDLGGKNPKQIATRITAITFAFGMVIVMTTYTAILTASKVQQAEKDPFLGFKDKRMTQPTSEFRFGCLANSSTSTYFRSSIDPSFRNMYLFMKKYNTKATDYGVKSVLNKQLQAFITEYPMAQFYTAKQRDCGLKNVQADKGKSSWAIAFQKGWAWNYLVSQRILEYRESGLFADLNRRWMASACSSVKNNTSSPSSVPLEYFGGLIIVLVASIVVSVLLLLVENLCNRYRKRISEPVKDTFAIWKEQREQKLNNIQVISFKQYNDVDKLART